MPPLRVIPFAMRAARSLRGITVGLAGLLQACVRSERPADFPRLPDGVPLAAWYEAEPIASEDYVAMVGETDFGHTQPRIRVERGAYRCGASDTRRPHGAVDAAIATCPPEMQTELERVQAPALVIFKSGGSRVVSALQLPHFLAPIDSAAKAALVVYGMVIAKGYGLELDPMAAPVRAVSDGFEVFAGGTGSEGECGGPAGRLTLLYYDVVILVRRDGAVEFRSRDLIARDERSDSCHPL